MICDSDNGLTLVELLAVIVLLGVLAGAAVPVYISHIKNAEREVCEFYRDTVGKNYQHQDRYRYADYTGSSHLRHKKKSHQQDNFPLPSTQQTPETKPQNEFHPSS